MDSTFNELHKIIKYKRGLDIINNRSYIKNFSHKITTPKKTWIPSSFEDVMRDALYLYAHICTDNLIYNKYAKHTKRIYIFNDILTLLQTIDGSDQRFFYMIYKNLIIIIEKTTTQINIFYSSTYETINDFRKNVFLCCKFIELIAKHCKLNIGYVNTTVVNLDITDYELPSIRNDLNISNSFRFSSLIQRDLVVFSSVERGLYNCIAEDITTKYKEFLNSKNLFSSKNLNYLVSVIYYFNCKRLGCFDNNAKHIFLNSTFPELQEFGGYETDI